MKDYISGREIDIQTMLDMARNADAADEGRGVFMGTWWCETAGCLCGTHILATTQLESNRAAAREEIIRKARNLHVSLGLSEQERRFLFTSWHLKKISHFVPIGRFPSNSDCATSAVNLTGPDALRRLRKFIYYKLRKNELMADYEQARRTGDVGVVGQVLETVG